MKQNTVFLALAVMGLIVLAGCGVAPEGSVAAEAVEVADATTYAIEAEPVLITSADHVPGVWQGSLAQGQSINGRYQVEPLPNGQVALKLQNAACHSSSLIVSTGEVSAILQASATQDQPVVGRYETQFLPNGEVAIKFKKADASRQLACRSM
jgi:hypothetical protein